jgi:hypothetical protein
MYEPGYLSKATGFGLEDWDFIPNGNPFLSNNFSPAQAPVLQSIQYIGALFPRTGYTPE